MADLTLSQMHTPQACRAQRWRDRRVAIGAGLYFILVGTGVWSVLDLLFLGRIADGDEVIRIVELGVAFGFGVLTKARLGSLDR